MSVPLHRFCDVSVPAPLDNAFTYELPDTLRHRTRIGCRVLVPFSGRKLIGVVIDIHDRAPEVTARQVLRLIDEAPALDAPLLALGRWISDYYCAPLGEVLRAMTPSSGEIRRSKLYSLTDAGRDIARQLLLGPEADDAPTRILRLLEARPLSAAHIKRKVENASRALNSLEKRGLVHVEEEHSERDPLRASSARLRVEFAQRTEDRLPKAERELIAYLELHPGQHNVKDLESVVAKASPAARALARKGLVKLEVEPMAGDASFVRPPHMLNTHQQQALDRIEQAINARKFQVFLLQGVTGSGKTEVYLRAIDSALAAGGGALMLVPEIALTPAVAGQFFHRFGERVALLHSAFSDYERAEQWGRIRSGAAGVVIGTRSSVFAPLPDLRLIIVDEEHDGSYKQEETPRYHGRDIAVVRAQAAGACVILGSATPSLESRYNVERGKYQRLLLPDRIEKRPMAAVEMIDMRVEFLETRKQAVFSRRVLDAIAARLGQGEQVMLLLNRRGFSSFVTCRSCGERMNCVNCAITLTFHRRDRRMLCHYCNYAAAVPKVCQSCSSEYLHFAGMGSERVEDELHTAFPRARIARMDRDTVSGKRHFEVLLREFREGSIDILVGTQMIAKGHDMPNVTLVGIVSADVGLAMPDFRAAERTFQLLTQAAGRAGRGSIPGDVLLQTNNPDHYAIRFASQQDYEGFYAKEIQFRKLMRYPPFAALANVLVRDTRQEEALRMSTEIGALLDPAPQNLRVLGPAEAPVPRIKSEYRYQLLIKAADRKALREALDRLRAYAVAQEWRATALIIDVDPLTLL